MTRRRAEAVLAVLLGAAAIILALVAAVVQFPRGLIVAGCLVLALAATWRGVVHGGLVRVACLALAAVALVAAVVLLLGRDPLISVGMVVAILAALAATRAAFIGHAALPAAQPPSKAVLFFNPKSGGGKAERFHIAEEARRRGIEPIELTFEEPLESLVEAALADGADALAAGGGDGTQAIVAAAAAAAGVPFACIPVGTRNHLALDLGVDRDDPVGALDAFVNGRERVVDLAAVNGRVFVNNVSLGLYAQAVQSRGYRDAKLRTLMDTVPEFAGPSGHAPAIRWRAAPRASATRAGWRSLSRTTPTGSAARSVQELGRGLTAGVWGRGDRPADWITSAPIRLWSERSLQVESDMPVAAGIDGSRQRLTLPSASTILPRALRVRIAPGPHPGMSPSALDS